MLVGPGIDQTNNIGLWIASDGVKTLLERTGSLRDVDPTAGVDLRTISGIDILYGGGGQDGYPFALTDARQLVYVLSFTDGSSGIFITHLVPEPSTILLAAFTVFAAGTKRWQRLAHS